jgi:hypothetical protein
MGGELKPAEFSVITTDAGHVRIFVKPADVNI